jgi:hypothetical protein
MKQSFPGVEERSRVFKLGEKWNKVFEERRRMFLGGKK